MNSDMVIGHQRILDFFDKVIAHGNLSHAYCFVAQPQVVKCAVAKYLAAKLLKVAPEKLFTQPDFTLVQQELNEKTGTTKQDIDIDQIRDLCAALARHAYLGGYKVAVIDEAEKMNASSANALLKALEEPKGNTLLFLITTDEALLPETIRSRCQMIYFQPVPRPEIKQYLLTQGVDESRAEELARHAIGLPGQALGWLSDPDSYEQYKKEVGRFVSLPKRPLCEKIQAVEDLFGDPSSPRRNVGATPGKSDHIATRERLESVLNLWLLLLRDQIYRQVGLDEYRVHRDGDGIDFTRKSLLSISQLIQEARDLLGQNVHPRLAVESVLLELS